MNKREWFMIMLSVAALFSGQAVQAKNLHLIEQSGNGGNGFAIYRSGAPGSQAEMKALCDAGVREIAVLSGNSADYEAKYQDACPDLEVVYDHAQKAKCALTKEFLESFDAWVEEAQQAERGVAFRCNCGCHRTGRLAAYYQLKYQGASIEEALAEMKQKGKWMWKFMPVLEPQVRAYEDFIEGRECRLVGKEKKFCVDDEPRDSKKCNAVREPVPIGD